MKRLVYSDILSQYTADQIEYVQDCYTDIQEDMTDNPQEIINDYLICAFDDYLLTDQDFYLILHQLGYKNR